MAQGISNNRQSVETSGTMQNLAKPSYVYTTGLARFVERYPKDPVFHAAFTGSDSIIGSAWETLSYIILYGQTDKMQNIPGAFGDVRDYFKYRDKLSYLFLLDDPHGFKLWDIACGLEEGAAEKYASTLKNCPIKNIYSNLAELKRQTDELITIWSSCAKTAGPESYAKLHKYIPYGSKAYTFRATGTWLSRSFDEYLLFDRLRAWRSGVPAEDIAEMPVKYSEPFSANMNYWEIIKNFC